MDIGIDLGTTFSVISVKGKRELAEGLEGRYYPEFDVTLIPNSYCEFTIPSVFWVSRDDPDEVVVGTDAKNKAAEGESPIMFSKRSIGTDEQLRLHDRTYTAKEVATHVLAYLKDCAERALGEPVTRAVITHPAYFDPNQVEETREAAIAAGFDMSLPEQMMMEPAAAALSYLHADERDPLTVLTYDLGGGTFDVTVLERREGVIGMKAFDGDHLLGGYNFDRRLAQWILTRLKEAGREIPYDADNPEHRSRRAQLLQLCETAKEELSRARGPKVPVNLKSDAILKDVDGRSVPILERITQEQYAELIRDYLDKTIRCCHQALGKANLEIEKVDEILLVGSSTYGPWVREAVKKSFGSDKVKIHEPDVCVAAGAALQAATLPEIAGGDGIEVVIDVPRVSALRSVNLAGHVRSADGSPIEAAVREELKAVLVTPTGTLGPCALAANGGFLFEDVELLEDEPTEFTLQVTDDKGLDRITRTVTVEHRQEGGGDNAISTALPKSLYLKTAEGLRLIAEEGKPLPAKCEVRLKKLFGDSVVEIDVYQGAEPIGKIRVDNIPEEAGEGSRVDVAVEITEKNEMRGTARVFLRSGGEVAAECPIKIKFPPIRLPELSELRASFDELEGKRLELLVLASDPAQKVALAGKGKRLKQKIEGLFAEQDPDRQELHREIREFDTLINPPPDDMDPPRAQFGQMVDACGQMLREHGSNPEVAPLQTALGRIERDGIDALATKNHRKWGATNEALEGLHDRLKRLAKGGGDQEQELPPTPILKTMFLTKVDGLRAKLRTKRDDVAIRADYEVLLKPRCDDLEEQIDQMATAIDRISDDLEPRQALAQIRIALRREAEVERKIPVIDIDTEFA